MPSGPNTFSVGSDVVRFSPFNKKTELVADKEQEDEEKFSGMGAVEGLVSGAASGYGIGNIPGAVIGGALGALTGGYAGGGTATKGAQVATTINDAREKAAKAKKLADAAKKAVG